MKERLMSGTRPILSIALFMIISLIVFAQEKQVEVTKTTTSTSTSAPIIQPWMYVLGAAIFVLLLVALLKGSGSKKQG